MPMALLWMRPGKGSSRNGSDLLARVLSPAGGAGASERGIAHAVPPVLQVAGEAPQVAGIRAGLDREIVPAEAGLEREPRVEALARTQLALDLVVVVAVGVRGGHPDAVGPPV